MPFWEALFAIESVKQGIPKELRAARKRNKSSKTRISDIAGYKSLQTFQVCWRYLESNKMFSCGVHVSERSQLQLLVIKLKLVEKLPRSLMTNLITI
jgi:hypothetical protein